MDQPKIKWGVDFWVILLKGGEEIGPQKYIIENFEI